MVSKVFPFPSDLPIGSQPFARETIARITALESTQDSGQSELLATVKGLGATVQNLSEQLVVQQAVVADLQARITRSASIDYTVSTGVLPKDSVIYTFGTPLVNTIYTPGIENGYSVTFTCGAAEILVTSRGSASSVLGRVALTVTGPGGTFVSHAHTLASRDMMLGTTPINSVVYALPQGTYTMTNTFEAWCSNVSNGDCEVRFSDPYTLAQVVV